MRSDKPEAIKLRLQGKSYREIQRILNVPLGTLSVWFKEEKILGVVTARLTKEQQEKSRNHILKLNKIREENSIEATEKVKTDAIEEFKKYKNDPLFVAGVTIYWGEGDKASKYNVRVANIDPVMIKVFVRFLKHICQTDVNRIKSWLLLYPDLNENECKKYWIERSGLSQSQFTKSIRIAGRHKTKRVGYGVCYVGVSSKDLKVKIKTWLELMSSELGK